MTKTMTGAERLRRLADVLDSVPVEQFTMNTWVVTPRYEFHGTLDPRVVENNRSRLSAGNLRSIDGRTRTGLMEELVSANECGYAGCAVGWAVCDPVLQEQGLSFPDGTRQPMIVADQVQWHGWDAVSLFFGLHPHDAEQLFSDSSYGEVLDEDSDTPDGFYTDPTPAEVAARIRSYVSRWGSAIGAGTPATGAAA